MNNVINRDSYLKQLIDKKENGQIKIITGIRRCGKSFLLFNLYRSYLLECGVDNKHIISIALDDIRFVKYRDPALLYEYILSRIDGEGMHYIFIDEVQYAISKAEIKAQEDVDLYNTLNGLLRLGNVDIYVTGSNSKMLTRDVLTAFRGRGNEVRVHPLAFSEYYSFVGGNKYECFEEYALYGGMPMVLSCKNDVDKMRYLKTLFDEVYFKDILERYSILHANILTELTDDLCSSIGSLTNASKIASTLKSVKNIAVSSNTVASYLEYLEESFLFSKAVRYDIKGKKYFEYPSKLYCTDIGLRNARLNFRQQEQTHIMENIIYNELLYRGYLVDVGVVEIIEAKNGVREKKKCEIDFVANMGSKRFYIQSALSLDDEAKLKTELRPFKNTRDSFKKIIVTKDFTKPYTDDNGIIHVNLYDFLLNEDIMK